MQQALVGEAFEEEAIEWMVLDVVWSQEDEEVVVHYYDIVDAANEDLTEDALREALEENEYYDCMERSTVREIKQWMKGINHAERYAHSQPRRRHGRGRMKGRRVLQSHRCLKKIPGLAAFKMCFLPE